VSSGDGVAVTYRRSTDVAAELEALVAAERDCCAFASWHVTPHEDKIVLTIMARTPADRAAVAELGAAFGA
jgi:hypothetical protein